MGAVAGADAGLWTLCLRARVLGLIHLMLSGLAKAEHICHKSNHSDRETPSVTDSYSQVHHGWRRARRGGSQGSCNNAPRPRWRRQDTVRHRPASHAASRTLLMNNARYPTHVWSPAGGWYTQPKNWRTNTFIVGAIIAGIVGMTWSVSADREHRTKMPEPGRFYPSR